MYIAVRGGHSVNCVGAEGIKKEQPQMFTFKDYVIRGLEARGHRTIDCTSNCNNQNADLAYGVNKANTAGVDLFISLHMNASDGEGHGTECLVHSPGCRAEKIAKNITNNFAKLGFTNRGIKYQPTYYEMRNTNAPNIIVETCFCDSEKDISIWSPTPWKTLADAVIKGICNEIIDTEYKEVSKSNINNYSEGDVEFNMTYKNGSTSESVYADSSFNNKIGSLNPHEECKACEIDGNILVYYNCSSGKKTGFVKWRGGIR